jgi:aldehyde:ferredoxin oxidoreductase
MSTAGTRQNLINGLLWISGKHKGPNMKVNCWGNPVLKVDLTTGRIIKECIDQKILKMLLLGRGLGDWLLFHQVIPGNTDPLSPDNVLVFGSGLLLGTDFPGAVRTSIVSLNTLTGGYGESSCGGYFATKLKRAGYDGLMITGKSPCPVYLWINDDRIEIREASKLLGRTTFETSAVIKEELKDPTISTCTIGPAGEKLVRYALVNCDNRYGGRCGMGAIMGCKNLKAIAVQGTGTVEVSNPCSFKAIAGRIQEELTNDPSLQIKAKYGLGKDTENYNNLGLLFIKNFQEVGFDRVSAIGYEAVKKYYQQTVPCPSDCPVSCNRLVYIEENEPYGGTSVSSLEATPAYNMAHLCVDDMPTVIKAFELCNGYGIDMHAWSTCMQWATECFEREIITREDTDKLMLRWGDGPLLLESIKRIALREGKFGNLLADGVARASKTLGRGSEKYAMQMKGMEIDDELRVDKGMAFGILTESRGTGHTLGAFFGGFDKTMTPEKAKKLYGTENASRPEVYTDKADLVVQTERYGAIQDCLGICWFSTHRAAPQLIESYNIGTYADLVQSATGWRVTEEELVAVAERVLTMEKSMNVLAGFERKDDYPPERFFTPIPNGPSRGMALDRDELHTLFKRHSTLHDWDPETGIPQRAVLEKMGLPDVAEKLESAGKQQPATSRRKEQRGQ